MSSNPVVKFTRQSILSLLDDLPPESLAMVETFVRFLRDQAQQGRPVVAPTELAERPRFRYPTVPMPASSLDKWMDLVPQGYDGDALADTEALYDEV